MSMDESPAARLRRWREVLAAWARATRAEYAALDYAFLLPFRDFFSTAALRRKGILLIFYLGGLPLLALQIHQWHKLPLLQATFFIILYFCLFWAAYFYTLLQPDKAAWRKALVSAAATAFFGIFVLSLLVQMPGLAQLSAGAREWRGLARLLACVAGVGLVEETVKALPLLFFARRWAIIRTPREGMLLGIMSGLAFAAVEGGRYLFSSVTDAIKQAIGESVTYTLTALQLIFAGIFNPTAARSAFQGKAEHAARAVVENVTDQTLLSFFRVMAAPILHAAWAGILGWFIAIAIKGGRARWPTMLVGLGFTSLLHGLYDAWSTNLLGLFVALASISIFVAYMAHGADESGERRPM